MRKERIRDVVNELFEMLMSGKDDIKTIKKCRDILSKEIEEQDAGKEPTPSIVTGGGLTYRIGQHTHKTSSIQTGGTLTQIFDMIKEKNK